jgi:hypothetical protein
MDPTSELSIEDKVDAIHPKYCSVADMMVLLMDVTKNEDWNKKHFYKAFAVC